MSSTVEVGTAKLVLTGDTTGLEVAIDRAKSKQQGLGAVAQAEADKMTAAQRKVVKSLDESIAKVGLDQKQRLQYRVIMQTEGAVRDALLAKINANTAAVTREGRAYEKTANAVNQYGLTAKQQTAALRQVPAQLTDIFVSLQGGQNPLTVLIQQGGQLKDVFGGVVPAAKALGGAVAGLISPWTVLAAIIGVAAVAYWQFESRQNALNRSLIMTGQQGRATAEDLNAIAASLDSIAGVTAGQASDALAQVVSSGRIAANQWELVTQAAVTTLNATGKAVKETVAEYEELSRDPTSAVLRLNESEHFLTQTLFDRIAAMQDAGDIEGAAALATETRAAAQIERDKQIEESLGLVSGAWYNIKRSAAEAWDESANYFTNLDRDAKQAVDTLGRLLASFRMGGVGGAFGMQAALSGQNVAGSGTSSPSGPTSQELAALKAIRDGNLTREQRQKLEEQQIINIKKLTAAQIDSDADIIASRKAYEASLPKDKSGAGAARSLANAEASLEIAQIKNQEEAQRNVIQNSTKLLQAEYSARIVSADAYYAKQRDLLQQDASTQEKSLTAQIAFLRERNVTGKDSVNVNTQIADLELRLTKVRADTATQTVILGIQEKELADKRKEAYQDYKYNLDRSVESIKKQVDAQIVAIMYGQREAEKQQKLTEIYDRQTEALRKLLLQKERKEISPEEYSQRVEAENQAAAQSADAVISGYERMKTAQADWLNGLRSGVADWIDQTQNVAQQINQMTTRALDGTVDALTTLFTTGKNTFKELLADIGKELVRFFAKQAVMKFISMFIGGGSSWDGSLTGNDSSNPFAGIGNGTISWNAKGGVYPGAAGLSALSGTILTRPTPFLFARGAALGVGGEAGPEAVMPLQRGPNGKLGVQMYGGGEGQQFNISITNNIQGGQSQSSTEGDQANSMRAFSENLSAQIKSSIQRSMLPGGDLYAAGVRA